LRDHHRQTLRWSRSMNCQRDGIARQKFTTQYAEKINVEKPDFRA
jgi:hypothetical protein